MRRRILIFMTADIIRLSPARGPVARHHHTVANHPVLADTCAQRHVRLLRQRDLVLALMRAGRLQHTA